jgi:hypothetical protein
MSRNVIRRFGAVFLFLLWGQVATANALPCGISCYLTKDAAMHQMPDGSTMADHPVGHHMSGPRLSAPEECGTPQLLVVAVTPADFPVSPSVHVAVLESAQVQPSAAVSAVPEFSTPPPRA